MSYQKEFRRCLEQCDVEGARKIWSHVYPHMTQPPASDEVTLVTIHMARTEMQSMSFKLRAWSHRWLMERNLPSALPDIMRPKAERMYPIIREAVGISVQTSSPARRDLAQAVQKAMSDAVAECYGEGKTDPEFVKARMKEARDRVMRGD